MKVFFGQIYVKPKVSFRFSLYFQQWLGTSISALVDSSDRFERSYPGFSLMFRISAKAGIKIPEIYGPTVFKKDKSIEYTIFLPYANGGMLDENVHRTLLGLLLASVADVLGRMGLDATKVKESISSLVYNFSSDAKMLDRSKNQPENE